jgi:hypothetical protein
VWAQNERASARYRSCTTTGRIKLRAAKRKTSNGSHRVRKGCTRDTCAGTPNEATPQAHRSKANHRPAATSTHHPIEGTDSFKQTSTQQRTTQKARRTAFKFRRDSLHACRQPSNFILWIPNALTHTFHALSTLRESEPEIRETGQAPIRRDRAPKRRKRKERRTGFDAAPGQHLHHEFEEEPTSGDRGSLHTGRDGWTDPNRVHGGRK